MPNFSIIIDDGTAIASDARSAYPDMDCAVRSTITAALLIAGEQVTENNADQHLLCEIQDQGSRELRTFTVSLSIEERRASRGGCIS